LRDLRIVHCRLSSRILGGRTFNDETFRHLIQINLQHNDMHDHDSEQQVSYAWSRPSLGTPHPPNVTGTCSASILSALALPPS
jgi:hypothetical protein